MKSQFVGFVLLSIIFVFIFSFGHISVIKDISASVTYNNPAEYEYDTLASVLGTVYYVRTDGNNGNEGTGPGSDDAWATIDYAVSKVSPGDVVYVKTGTYQELVTISSTETGEAGLPIQIIGDSSGSVFNTTPGNITIDGTTSCIYIDGGDYYNFKNFVLTSCTSHGIYLTGESLHNTFEGLEITSVGSGSSSAIYLDGTSGDISYTTITDCTISGDAFGVYLKDNSPHCVITGCDISGFTSAGIYIEDDSDYSLISQCKISNSSTTSHGIYVYGSENCNFVNNFIYGYYSSAAVYDEDNDNISWNFNSVLNNENSAGTDYGYHGKRSGAYNVASFKNNIVMTSDTSGSYVMYIEGTGSNWLPDELDYNDYYCTGIENSNYFYYGSGITFANWQSATSKDTHSNIDDPNFTSTSNLYLQADSPCLGAGTSITGITEDIDGDERNTDGHPCIGADELQTLEVSTTTTINWNLTIGDVTVQTGGTLTLDSASFNLGDISVEDGGTLIVSDNAEIECDDVTVADGGTITFDGTTNEVFLSSRGHFDIQANSTANIEGLVTIRAKQGTISSTLDGEGNAGSSGSGAGTDIDTSTNDSPSGAGHGGDGGAGINTTGGSEYGDIIDPFEVGSKGGDIKSSTTVLAEGGYGGASLKVFVSGTLTVNSAVNMNGADGLAYVGAQIMSTGGGSGGSVLISAGILTGSGSISANGGEAPDAALRGGGGAGGRIVIYSGLESTWTSDVTVTGGAGNSNGEDGTYLHHQVENDNGICLNCGVSSTEKDSAFTIIEAANQAQSWIHTSATGGLSIEQKMISLSGPGPNPSVSIYYNSNEASTIPTSLQPLGIGWNHTFNQYLIVNTDYQGDRNTVSWHRPCGQRYTFWDVDGDATEDYTCIPVYGLNSEVYYDTLTGGSAAITETSGNIPGRAYGGWKLVTKSKTLYFKDFEDIDSQSVALLDTIIDNFDRRLTLEYSGTQLTYVQDSLDQSNDNTQWRRVYFTYSLGLITKIEAKYWANSGTQITGKERNITYDSGILQTAGVSTSDWHWKYTYSGYNITRREIWDDTTSTGYYIEYAYANDRVALSRVGGEDIFMEYTYTNSNGKVEVDGRQYDDSNRMEWYNYTDSVYHSKVEDQIQYTNTDGTTDVISIANRKFDTYSNVIEQVNVNGLKTKLSYKDKTNSLEKTLVYDSTTIVGYTENVYDNYLNITESYGPCIVSSANPTKTISPVKETKVEYNYENTTYQAKHLIRYIRKYTSESAYFQTEYAYAVVSGQQSIDDYYQLDYTLANNQSGTSTTDQLKVDYTYYSGTNVAVGVIKGFVSQIQKDDNNGSTASLNVITKYRHYISGALKETTDPMGITSQIIYDSDGFGRALGQCSDADHVVILSSVASDASGSVITTSTNHGLSAGDYVTIVGTTYYDSTYQVASVPAQNQFVITQSYTAETFDGYAYAEKLDTGFEQGSISVYHTNGLINYTQSGAFSNWDQNTSAYAIDLSEAYSRSDYKFDSTYGRLIATRGRDLGSSDYRGTSYIYFGNGAIDETYSGKIDWTVTPPTVFTTGVNYSHSRRSYYSNGWLKQSENLITGTTFATTELTYNEDGSTYYTKGPKYGDNDVDVYESYRYYDSLGRNVRTSNKVGVGQWSNSETVYDDEYFRVEQQKQEKIENSYYTTAYTYAEEAATPEFYPNRVIKVTAPGPDPATSYRTEYTYDAYGRVTTTKHAAQSTSNEENYSHQSYDVLGRVIWSGVTDYQNSTPGPNFVNCKNRVKRFYNYNSAIYSNWAYSDSSNYTQTDSLYNTLGQTVATCTDPTGLKLGSATTYNTLGQVTESKQSKFSSFSNASASYVVTKDDTTSYTWDGSAKKLTTAYTYDEMGRRETIVNNPNGATYGDLTTTYAYDELSNIEQVTDANSKVTSYEFNNSGWQTKVTNALSVPTEYSYYNDGKRKQYTYYQQAPFTAANAITVLSEYYPSGATASVLYPGYNPATPTTGNVVRENTFQYNLAGQMTQSVYGNDPSDGSDNGNTIGYVYDSAGRLQYYDEGDDQSYERQYVYNDRNQVEEIKRDSTGEYFTNYDGYGRTASVQDKSVFSAGKTVTYTYYDNGMMKSLADPESEYTFYYHYDKASRLFQISNNATVDTGTIYNEYAYNALSQKTNIYYGSDTSNNGYSSYSYLDDVGWLTNIENKVSTNTYSQFKYYDSGWSSGEKFDNLGNIKRTYYNIRTDNATPNPTFSEGNIHYTYDDIYQLNDEERKESDNSTRIYLYEYAYDKFGNRTDKDVDTDGDGNIDEYYDYTYNPANELVYEDGPTNDWYYVYDGNGNLTYRKDDLSTPEHTDAYSYNYQNQLTTYNPEGYENTTTYTYNLAGQRVQKNSDELETNHKLVYANGQIITEYDANSSDVLLRTNIWGSRATTFISNGTPDVLYYTFRDGFNSVYNVINASGSVQNTYDYTAFGEPYDWSGSFTNDFTFQTNQYNSESTAYFNGITYRNPYPNILFETNIPQLPQSQPKFQLQTQENQTQPQTNACKKCVPSFIMVDGNGTAMFVKHNTGFKLGAQIDDTTTQFGYGYEAFLWAGIYNGATIANCSISEQIFMFVYARTKSGKKFFYDVGNGVRVSEQLGSSIIELWDYMRFDDPEDLYVEIKNNNSFFSEDINRAYADWGDNWVAWINRPHTYLDLIYIDNIDKLRANKEETQIEEVGIHTAVKIVFTSSDGKQTITAKFSTHVTAEIDMSKMANPNWESLTITSSSTNPADIDTYRGFTWY